MEPLEENKAPTEPTTPEVNPTKEETAPSGGDKKFQEEIAKLKEALSKANSSAAEYKRALREKQTEQERIEAERAERDRLRDEELERYKTKDRISTYTSGLMNAGIDGETASLMANALPEGVKEEFFATLKTFNVNQRKAMDVSALNKQPGLSVGMPPSGAAKSDLDKQLDKIFGL